MSARVPKCQKIKNGWLDQYGTEPFKQQQFETTGIEGVNNQSIYTSTDSNIQRRQWLSFAGNEIIEPAVQQVSKVQDCVYTDLLNDCCTTWCKNKYG